MSSQHLSSFSQSLNSDWDFKVDLRRKIFRNLNHFEIKKKKKRKAENDSCEVRHVFSHHWKSEPVLSTEYLYTVIHTAIPTMNMRLGHWRTQISMNCQIAGNSASILLSAVFQRNCALFMVAKRVFTTAHSQIELALSDQVTTSRSAHKREKVSFPPKNLEWGWEQLWAQQSRVLYILHGVCCFLGVTVLSRSESRTSSLSGGRLSKTGQSTHLRKTPVGPVGRNSNSTWPKAISHSPKKNNNNKNNN